MSRLRHEQIGHDNYAEDGVQAGEFAQGAGTAGGDQEGDGFSRRVYALYDGGREFVFPVPDDDEG